MKKILTLIICIFLLGCKSNKQIYQVYKNKNNNEISLFENGDFKFISYDGLQGQYFSIGTWYRNSDNTIVLKNRDVLPKVEFKKSKSNTNSTIVVNDFRVNNHEIIEVYLNNIKMDFNDSPKVSIDSKLFLVELYLRNEKIKLISDNFDNNFYDLIIYIHETYNEISIDTLEFDIKGKYIYDKKNKEKYFKRDNITSSPKSSPR